ncbi:hypothetical protein GOP47_0020941 [Adiantum capillus-veneris]|uniref:Uncharacterized protein n=1 Tax=Adiantum capillus-veneris TaxID=13818 RepID=A0A9D4Z965_ADICA|nr:hypothetical protein GOP47_0020941 [Adiantum capillus-veneris]
MGCLWPAAEQGRLGGAAQFRAQDEGSLLWGKHEQRASFGTSLRLLTITCKKREAKQARGATQYCRCQVEALAGFCYLM